MILMMNMVILLVNVGVNHGLHFTSSWLMLVDDNDNCDLRSLEHQLGYENYEVNNGT